jgi:hypothetical protein
VLSYAFVVLPDTSDYEEAMMEAWQQYQRLSRLLSHDVKLRIRQVVPLYLDRVRSVQDPQSLYRAAVAALKLRFPSSSPEETDVLAFYLVGLAAAAERGMIGKLDSMNEMSEMTSLRLQMTMERRSKFIQTLSNIMLKISSTQDSIVQNLK